MRSLHEARTWRTKLELAERWARHVKKELSVVDTWAELAAQTASIAFDRDAEEPAKFTSIEIGQVRSALAELKSALQGFAGADERRQQGIADGIDRLLESAKTGDRKTWFYPVVGFIASTAV